MNLHDELARLEALEKAAHPAEQWQENSEPLKLFTTKADGGEGAIWYGDGDQCALVIDNLGLGVSGLRMAELLAQAAVALPSLIAKLRAAHNALRAIGKIKSEKDLNLARSMALSALLILDEDVN